MDTYSKIVGNNLFDESAQIQHLRGLGLGGSTQEFEQALTLIEFHRFANFAVELFDTDTDKFYPGMVVEDVLFAHEFDRELRKHIFSLIQIFEVWFRKQLVDLNTLQSEQSFIDQSYENFDFSYLYKEDFNPTISNREVHRKDLKFISNEFIRKFSTEEQKFFTDSSTGLCLPPVSLAFERMTFKSLEKWFKNTKTKYRKDVANRISLPEPIFSSLVGAFCDWRNNVAHHSKCWVGYSRAIKKFAKKGAPEILLPFVHEMSNSSAGYFISLVVYVVRHLDIQDPSLTAMRDYLTQAPIEFLEDMEFAENFFESPLWNFELTKS